MPPIDRPSFLSCEQVRAADARDPREIDPCPLRCPSDPAITPPSEAGGVLTSDAAPAARALPEIVITAAMVEAGVRHLTCLYCCCDESNFPCVSYPDNVAEAIIRDALAAAGYRTLSAPR